MKWLLILLALLALMSFKTVKPKKLIRGVVKSSTGNIPIPFANVFFKESTYGTRTDINGVFILENKHRKDTLIISVVGYKPDTIPVTAFADSSVTILLKEENYAIKEVVIRPGENPAFAVLRHVEAEKQKNNPSNISRYRCETSTKIVVRYNSKGERKPDSDTISSESGMPVYYSEKRALNTIDTEKSIEDVKVLSNTQNGLGMLADFQVEGYESAMSAEVNFYQNKINLFGKLFYSPIGVNGRDYYKYYLKDSSISNGRPEYTIEFKPKYKKDLAFKGIMHIDKATWALKDIETTLPKSANINYLTAFAVKYDYAPVNDTTFFFKSNTIKAEFYYKKVAKPDGKRTISVTKTTAYSNIAIGNDTLQTISNLSQNTVLTPDEVKINNDLDSLNRLWWMRMLDKGTTAAVTGYFPLGKIDLGPYLDYVKRNKIEGLRLTLGLRTGESFSPYYSVYGKVGYGFRDKAWKYGGQLTFKPPFKHRTLLGLGYDKDMTIIGSNDNVMLLRENSLHGGDDNIIAALASRRINDRLSISENYSFWGERELIRGLSAKLLLNRQIVQSGEFVPFTLQGTPFENISSNSISIRTRISFREKTVDKFLRRYYLGTKYPIINIVATGGQYRTPFTSGNFFKIHLAYKHTVPIGLGKLLYIAEAGAIAGKVPFPLLEVHRGNETFGYSRFRFNTLNNMQMASDRYVSLFGEYHMNGAIVNKIPLLRELNIREVFSAKALVGSLSERHRQVMDFPLTLKRVSKPFLEIGGGFENIVNFLRIECIYRVSPAKLEMSPRFVIKARFQVDF